MAWEAHALRGTCSVLSAGRITELAAGVEDRAERGLLEGAEEVVARLAGELERVRSLLEARRPDVAPAGTSVSAGGKAGTKEP